MRLQTNNSTLLTAEGRVAARIENRGIPTVIVTREDFVGVVRNAFAGLGFDQDAPMITFYEAALAGGYHPTHNFWLQACAPSIASRTITLPAAWEALIAEADTEP